VTRDRRGFALIAAIWLMVTLSAIGLEVALLARTRRLSSANASESARSRAAADAGLEHARARLTRRLADAPDPSVDAIAARDPWRAFARAMPDTIALDDARYFVRLDDASARVNVNVASEAQLRRLFAALRIDAGASDRLAQAVADWRDADDFVRARGAEREAYLDAGLPALPRNAPLVSLAELRDVFGMSPAIFSAVSSHVTVLGSGKVNVNTADRAVLLSLPGTGEETVVAALRLRASGVAISSLEQLAAALTPGARNQLLDATAELLPLVTFETRELEVTSDGWLAGSPVRVRASGLFVRGGGAVFVQARRTE
jgi:general secretion pathway protein K